jgi:hypothetical protein
LKKFSFTPQEVQQAQVALKAPQAAAKPVSPAKPAAPAKPQASYGDASIDGGM